MEMIAWEPGNGSRYPLMFVDSTDERGHRTWVIGYLRNSNVGGSCFKWHGDFVNLDYMMDKMGLTNEYDAQAIATFLYTRGVTVELGWREEWRRFNRAEELGFDKLLMAS